MNFLVMNTPSIYENRSLVFSILIRLRLGVPVHNYYSKGALHFTNSFTHISFKTNIHKLDSYSINFCLSTFLKSVLERNETPIRGRKEY